MTNLELVRQSGKSGGSVSAGPLLQLVSFRLGVEEYGVEIMKVQEIIRCQEITRVPQMPPFLEGVINLRGSVIPVISLRKRFEMEVKPYDNATRIIVVNVDDRTIGVVVDAVSEVLRIAAGQIEPPPAVVAGLGREYLRGVGKLGNRILILLDLDRVLTSQEVIRLGALHGADSGEPGK